MNNRKITRDFSLCRYYYSISGCTSNFQTFSTVLFLVYVPYLFYYCWDFQASVFPILLLNFIRLPLVYCGILWRKGILHLWQNIVGSLALQNESLLFPYSSDEFWQIDRFSQFWQNLEYYVTNQTNNLLFWLLS